MLVGCSCFAALHFSSVSEIESSWQSCGGTRKTRFRKELFSMGRGSDRFGLITCTSTGERMLVTWLCMALLKAVSTSLGHTDSKV